ncbi:MAG TPA: hypothetical protein VNS34_03585 [Rhizobiaceae bacterium]|nr:hypothetical protein [Rhizobiaceae bacterium]
MACLAEKSLAVSVESETVSSVLSEYEAGDIVSTAALLRDIRQRLPGSRMADEDLVALILQGLSAKALGLIFDHRAA